MQNTIRISEEFLDMVVNALTALPYRDVQPIFERLGIELNPPAPPEPKIIIN
jgi:hypothetical protein